MVTPDVGAAAEVCVGADTAPAAAGCGVAKNCPVDAWGPGCGCSGVGDKPGFPGDSGSCWLVTGWERKSRASEVTGEAVVVPAAIGRLPGGVLGANRGRWSWGPSAVAVGNGAAGLRSKSIARAWARVWRGGSAGGRFPRRPWPAWFLRFCPLFPIARTVWTGSRCDENDEWSWRYFLIAVSELGEEAEKGEKRANFP